MADRAEVGVRRLAHAADLPLPTTATEGSAGYDLRAALIEPLELASGAWEKVPTGLVLEIPPGYEGQIRPRSGLAARHGVTLLNSPGTVDSDYRGEVSVLLVNHGPRPITIRRGDRIAQLVVGRCHHLPWVEVDDGTTTTRGAGGFGSTGAS